MAKHFDAGPDEEVISVPENDLGSELAEFIGRNALDAPLGSNRHKGGRFDGAMRRDELAPARLGMAIGGQHLEHERRSVSP